MAKMERKTHKNPQKTAKNPLKFQGKGGFAAFALPFPFQLEIFIAKGIKQQRQGFIGMPRSFAPPPLYWQWNESIGRGSGAAGKQRRVTVAVRQRLK